MLVFIAFIILTPLNIWATAFTNNPKITDTDIRIGLAQIFVEAAGVIAFVLVAWEFYQAQHEPELTLWMAPETDSKDTEKPTNILKNGKPSYEHYLFKFRLLLRNDGQVAARWIKISIEIKDKRPNNDERPATGGLGRIFDAAPGKWNPGDTGLPAGHHQHRSYIFQGADEFISYPNPQAKRPELLNKWNPTLEHIGDLWYMMPVAKNEADRPNEITLLYSIQSHNSSVLEQTELRFHLDPNT